MKKSILTLLGAGLLMTSCQSDEPFAPGEGGEKQVTFTLNVPGELGTRADFGNQSGASGLANNSGVTRYFTLVLDANGDTQILKASNTGTSATFTPTVVLGRNYTITAYASLDDNALIDDKEDIEAIEVSKNFNDETKDAYFHTTTYNFADGDLETLSLRRPFGKLRLVATDYKADGNGNTAIKSVKVKYNNNVFTTFNAVSGEFSGEKSYEYTLDETNNYSTSYYAPEVDGQTIFADYIPVNETGVAPFTVTVEYENGETYTREFAEDIPVKRNALTTLKGNFFTAGAKITVIVEDDFDNTKAENINFVSVGTTAELQEALDAAVPGTVIKLNEGVNYGVVYMRPVAGSPATKDVDWIGNNYRWETYTLFEDLTIVGAEGATVDAVKIEGGTYYNTEHSQKDAYPVMLSLIELKNVVFDGVTFTGKGGYDPQGYGNAVNLSGSNIKVDGLTFKNCVLNNNANNARLLYKTESTTHVHNYAYNGQNFTFIPSLKDITITDCAFNGGYMGLELREAENVTITNNVFNVANRNILLPVNTGCTYSGNITITGNISNNAKERFVRADGTGDAVVVIKNNKILNYQGDDADYIKVTNGSNVTIEDNFLGKGATTADELNTALANGGNVVLTNDIDFGSTQLAITGENQVVDLGGHTLTIANNWGCISLKNGACIKNGTITHTGNVAAIKAFNGTSVENVTINATCLTAGKTVTGIAVQQGANIESIKNVTINGVSQGIEVGYQATVGLIENAVVNESNNGTAKGIGLVINGGMVGKAKNCTFKGETYGITLHLKGVFAAGLELENCEVEGTTASIYAWDEKGISNTSGSLILTYDAATTLIGPFIWDFEDECKSVVTLNRPQ